jgi:spore germination protein KC
MSRFQKIATLALVCVMLAVSTGCWDRKEIDDLNVVTLIGFDRIVVNGEPRILATACILKSSVTGAATGLPSTGGGGTSSAITQTVSVEGKTIADAARNFFMRTARQIYLGHILGVIIGEDLAREGIEEVIEAGSRNPLLRYRTQLVVCDGTALDALQATPEFEALHATELVKTIEFNSSFLSKSVQANLFRVAYDMMTPGRDPVLPHMNPFTPPERGSGIRKGAPSGTVEIEGESTEDEKTSENAGVEQSTNPEKKTFRVDGSAVFQGDRLVGWLNGDESKGFLFITGRARGGAIPFAFRSPDENVSYAFRNVKTEVRPVIGPGGITFEVGIRGDGGLTEIKDGAIDVLKDEDIRAAEQQINEEIQDYCLKAVAKCQSVGSDAFGFGDLIHRAEPAYWKQIKDRWRDYYPAVKVQVRAKFIIRNTGVTNESVRAWQ